MMQRRSYEVACTKERERDGIRDETLRFGSAARDSWTHVTTPQLALLYGQSGNDPSIVRIVKS